MKLILSVLMIAAMMTLVAGCKSPHPTTKMKLIPSGGNPEVKLKDHVSYATCGRLRPYNDEWRNVKSEFHKPDSPSMPYTATITAEVYTFDSAKSTTAITRTDYEVALTHKGSRWCLTGLQANIGPIGREKWYSQGKKTLSEKDPQWKVVARELEVVP